MHVERYPRYFVHVRGFKSDAALIKAYGRSQITVVTKKGNERTPNETMDMEDIEMLVYLGQFRELSTDEVPEFLSK